MDSTTHPDTKHQKPDQWGRLAWLPIPLLLSAIIAARMAGLNESHQSPALLLILSFTFYTLVSLGTLYIIGRSFLKSGSPGLLLLECGVVLWSLAGTVGDFVYHGDVNINVTIFNTGILLAGLCHLAGAIIALRPQRDLRAAPVWLGAGWALSLGALWLVAHAALAGWLPVFFIQGHGGTPVRFFVLISAISMFVLSAGLLKVSQRTARLPFTSWYALAMLLLAVGLFGIMIQLSMGSAVNWLSRTAQWLGGIYLLIAAVAALRESNLPLLPAVDKTRPEYYRGTVAVAVVLTAAALRLTFLSAMGMRAPYVTFYPAVIFAALYGGLRAGLLASVLSAILADYYWIEPANQFTKWQPHDWLSLMVFLLCGALVSWITDAMHSARARANFSEAQALLAAERVAASEALRESEKKYHNLFETMSEGFSLDEIILDDMGNPVDLRYLSVNPAFERHTGLKAGDIVGRTTRDLFPEAEPVWFEQYGKVALTGEPAHFEERFGPLNKWFDVRAYQTEPGRFAVMFYDITERKQAEDAIRESEERFRGLVEQTPEGIFVADALGRYLDVNSAGAQMLGYTQEEICRMGFADVLAPEEMARLPEAVDRLAGGTVDRNEWRFKRKDGSFFIGEVVGRQLPDGRLQGILRDMTAHKQAEAMLKNMNKELEMRVAERTHELANNMEMLKVETAERIQAVEALREKEQLLIQQSRQAAMGEMIGNIAHQWRQPLNTLGLTIQQLSLYNDLGEFTKEFLDDSVKKSMEVIKHMSRTIDDFRNYFKPDKEKIEFTALKAINSSLTLTEDSFKSQHIGVELVTTGDSVIHGYRNEFAQVVLNILNNARDVLVEREIKDPKVAITLGSENGRAVVTIADNAGGIPEEIIGKIFDPYFTTKGPQTGTGVGLFMSKTIIEKNMCGRLTVRNTGNGAEFRIEV